ncbi:MAG: methyltransferase domain-containing protein [Clostridia bacterium]|nr:methyltransferase domain-containing protein [Clostridia bacterium]
MSVYICPVCGKPLNRVDKTMRCENNHSYDISAKGYVNLLGPGKIERGDDADMVAARRRFLNSGSYDALRNALCEVLSNIPFDTLLDAGCGEGYYTKKLCDSFDKAEIYGLDISKKAAEKASALCKAANICVASAYRMPYADGSFDCILNVFSPLAADEYIRVLKKGGHLVMAAPLPEHLSELKRIVYDKVNIKTMKDTDIEGFFLVSEKQITYTMQLDTVLLKDLFTMTPYYHKTSYEDKVKLDSVASLTVTAAFTVFDYIKD